MKLILLNGPSGIGKSTISTKLADELLNTVVIDVDELRRSIPDYRENREESLRLSYERTKEEIRAHLAAGENVIVDKAIRYSDTIDTLIEEGRKGGAEVYEFMLHADKSSVQQRADERGYRPGSLLTREKVGEMWEWADKLQTQRPNAIIVDTTHLTADETLERIKSALI
jgi:broad-specificity NMP kinase